jgi:hypothetical protein
MYPVRAPASAPLGTGLAAYVGNLSTGHLSERKLPGIINCNCGQPLVDAVGNWLVYVNDQNTVSAVPAGLTGKARILGLTNMFMPAATPGQVWLEYQTNGPTVVRSVPVAGGPAGPPVSLPLGTALIEGTAAGLLLQQDSNTGVLESGPRPGPPSAIGGCGGSGQHAAPCRLRRALPECGTAIKCPGGGRRCVRDAAGLQHRCWQPRQLPGAAPDSRMVRRKRGRHAGGGVA